MCTIILSVSEYSVVRLNGTLLLSHVDDLFLAGKETDISKVKTGLSKDLEVKDLGPAACYLAMEIERNRRRGTIKLSQKRYIGELVEKFGSVGAKHKD